MTRRRGQAAPSIPASPCLGRPRPWPWRVADPIWACAASTVYTHGRGDKRTYRFICSTTFQRVEPPYRRAADLGISFIASSLWLHPEPLTMGL